MFGALQNFSEIISLVTFIFGSLAGYRAGQLAFRPNTKKLRRSVLTTLALLVLAVLGVLALPALAGPLISYDWDFASNRFIVGLPPMVIATVAAAVWSVPRMWRLRRQAAGAGGEPSTLPAPVRHAASDPQLVVPVQAVGISGFLAAYMLMVVRPVPPYTLDVLGVNAILFAVGGLLWLRQTRRQRISSGEEIRRTRFGMRVLHGVGGVVVVTAVSALVIIVGSSLSKMPGTMDMANLPNKDYGGGPKMDSSVPLRNVADLTGGDDVSGKPDKTFTLTAVKKTMTFSSGRSIEVWAYNGQIPGPTLTINEGDLVEITVINQIPGISITAHWHGLNVPNAEDGVPGITQNAIPTGGRHTYRFRMHQVGTFWYHSHQSSLVQVDRGLYGALVSLPRGAKPDPYDMTVVTHDWKMLKDNPLSRTESVMTFDATEGLLKRAVPPGKRVRLRVINSGPSAVNDEATPTFTLTGAPFKVAATDGTDINQPTELQPGTRMRVGTGGRIDLTFTMPDAPVRLSNLENLHTGLVLSPSGTEPAPPPEGDGPMFDRLTYGASAPTPFGLDSHFDRNFKLVLDDGPGFYNGGFNLLLKINGEVFPNTPVLMVREGDLVKITFVNRGHVNHPMHLHGHQLLVLSRNGKPVTGSPWWTDTLEVRIGEKYEVAFLANNPGIWLDHCHNLQHASKGMVMHLAYEGVTTPYRVGVDTGNTPEGQKK